MMTEALVGPYLLTFSVTFKYSIPQSFWKRAGKAVNPHVIIREHLTVC